VAPARARQRSTLSRLAHKKSVDPALSKLLDDLASYGVGLPYDLDEASLIRVARREFEKAIKVPADYVARASALGSASYDAWTRARPANDFASVLPFLERAVDLSREYAGFFTPYKHVADPLIDAAEEGMITASVRSLFAELRSELMPIVRAISDQPVLGDDCLRGFFREPAQLDFSLPVVRRFGYDMDRGRLDKTHHPFCAKFSGGDVRKTTRNRQSAETKLAELKRRLLEISDLAVENSALPKCFSSTWVVPAITILGYEQGLRDGDRETWVASRVSGFGLQLAQNAPCTNTVADAVTPLRTPMVSPCASVFRRVTSGYVPCTLPNCNHEQCCCRSRI
jgi:hypothetical protein